MKLNNDWVSIKSKIKDIKPDIEKLDISQNLIIFLIAAEDHRFGKHPGVDPVSLCRAIWRSLFCGKREGGSTIAMQLVRVITGRYERTICRKISEIYFAIRLNQYLKNFDLPKLYLVLAYYGWRMNGLKQASTRLQINLSSISNIEAANIVARLKYPEPSRYDEKRLKKINERARFIINRSDKLFGILTIKQPNLGNANGSI